ncbi:AraC family transcriptional regulator [Paenibacillus lemnae]|uniref:AraC family transcriptional regulator n=1 Tax=Paenibacillus lemnae TaxID=1330551 RepID=A0A848M249_PAELE|nr:helix-turn-helix domain-containing protein [Paenibacillus lemnae]NMO94957.1 AraC family transcriptional regulator [Paenibacillus lemnae]
MFRHHFLPAFDEFNFFCFPHSVGKYTCPADHNVTRDEGVKDFSLHYVVGGKGYIELNDNLYTMKAGDAFLHVPFQRMRYYTSEDDPWVVYWMQFNGSKLADFLLEKGFYETSIWFLNDADLLEQSFLDLMDEIERYDISRPSKMSALSYTILTEFTTRAIPFASRKGKAKIEMIIELLPNMQKNAHLPFVMKDWADQVGLTPNYFCNLFKKVTKTTPLAYITKCRIHSSKQLLLSHPHMPIHQIAEACGYPTASYFNKIFMEMEGVTPTEFRMKYSAVTGGIISNRGVEGYNIENAER